MKKNNTKTKTKKHDPNNGVTTQWLIELSKSIWNNSWVHTTMLSSDGIDMLIIRFKDISGDEWIGKVYENKIVELDMEVRWGDDEPFRESHGNVKLEDFMKYLNSLPVLGHKFFSSVQISEDIDLDLEPMEEPVVAQKNTPKDISKKSKSKKTIKLIEGYEIHLVADKKNQFALYKVQKLTGETVFTGLLTECKSIEDAIKVFNDHIPILEDSILDEPVLIRLNE